MSIHPEMTFECPHLSKSIWIGPGREKVYPCCYTTKGIEYPRVEYTDDVLNHPVLVDMRRSALKGEIPELCSTCVRVEKEVGFGPRLKNQVYFTDGATVKEYVTPQDIEWVYISIDNVCNYKCIMCSPYQSHLIAKEYKLTQRHDGPTHYTYTEERYDKLIDMLSQMHNLKWVQISGGEPFYQRDSLKKLLDCLPKHINISSLHTNGSLYDTELLDVLAQFNSVSLAWSIDGMGQGYNATRIKGDWETVRDNFIRFSNEYRSKKFESHINATINCFNLDTTLDLINDYSHYFDHMALFPVRHPTWLKFHHLDPQFLRQQQTRLNDWYQLQMSYKIKERMSGVRPEGMIKYTTIHIKQLNVEIEDAIKNRPTAREIDNFKQNIAYMKKQREADICSVVPHLVEHLTSLN